MASNDDILALAAERFQQAAEADRDERIQADEDNRFAINDEGCQWDPELKRVREGGNPPRPCLVLNKIPEKIDQVEGEFKQLRPSIKVRAVDNQADPKVAEIIAGQIRHIEYDSQARNAYNTSHSSTLHCGRGAWRIDVVDSLDDPFVRDIKINRIPNPLTVYWDPYAKAPDKSDANYFFVTEIVSEKEFEAEYGKEVAEDFPVDDIWMDWKTDKGYRVAEYWWKEKEKKAFYRVTRNINGVPTEMTVTEKKKGDKVVEEKKVDWPKVKWCKMVAGKIIEGPHDDWGSKYIPIVVQIGKETNVRGKSKTRGMVRFAKQPQQLYNYWSSAVTEMIALAPKAPYLVTAAMIKEYKPLWDAASTQNLPYLPYNVDEMAPGLTPKREAPPMMSSALQHEFIRMDHDIMSAMGVYQAQLGDEGQEVSGRAILARQRQGNIGSYPYTDSFHIALTYSTKILIDLIPSVYDTERVVRIMGPDDEEDTVPINARVNPLNQQPVMPEFNEIKEQWAAPREGITEYLNDITVGKYDVAVTIGPSYTTQREESLTVLMEMIKTAPALALNIMDLVVQSMDMPHSEELIKRLKKMVPLGIREPDEGEQPPEQPPDPKVMIEMAKLELEKARVQIEDFAAQAKAIKDLADAESKEQGQQLEAMRLMLEEIRGGMDRQAGMQQKSMDLDAQRQQQERDLEAQAGQQSMDMDFQREQAAMQPPPTGAEG